MIKLLAVSQGGLLAAQHGYNLHLMWRQASRTRNSDLHWKWLSYCYWLLWQSRLMMYVIQSLISFVVPPALDLIVKSLWKKKLIWKKVILWRHYTATIVSEIAGELVCMQSCNKSFYFMKLWLFAQTSTKLLTCHPSDCSSYLLTEKLCHVCVFQVPNRVRGLVQSGGGAERIHRPVHPAEVKDVTECAQPCFQSAYL